MKLPTRLGGFELTEKLGAGAMGTVYRATQTSLHRQVVIKTLHPHLMEAPDLIARFEREARHAAGLMHPNTVQVIEFGFDQDHHYIAMEYVDGMDLKEVLRLLGPFPPDVFVLVMRDICRGMEAAHARDLIHRDLKPANLMIRRDGVVKVMDFGLARETAESSTITQHGSVMGSAAYMSPEQAQGLSIDHRSDVFSLGLVGYELASNIRAFPGDTYAAVLRAVVFDEILPLTEVRTGLPDEIYNIISSMTVKELEGRCPSMAEARDRLETLAQQMGLRSGDRNLAEFVRRADALKAGRQPPAISTTVSLAETQAEPPASRPPAGDKTVGGETTGMAGSGVTPAAGAAPGQAGSGSGAPPGADRTSIAPGAHGDTPGSPAAASGRAKAQVEGGAAPAGTDRATESENRSGNSEPSLRHTASSGSGPSGSGPSGSGPSGSSSSPHDPGNPGAGDGYPTSPNRKPFWAALALIAVLAGAFGIWLATRGDSPPIPVVGACCHEDGSCTVVVESRCLAADGVWTEGECEPNPCPQPEGACCLSDGDCVQRTEAECADEGGTFEGAGVTCTEAECPEPSGACCLSDGNCLDATAKECADKDGRYQGDGTVCASSDCPQPQTTGACCAINGTCTVVVESDCTGSRRFLGAGKSCEPNPCQRTEPVKPFKKEYTVSTIEVFAEVRVDDETINRNTLGNFAITLSEGTHRFHLYNKDAGVDRVVTYTVRRGDPNTKLILNPRTGQVVPRP